MYNLINILKLQQSSTSEDADLLASNTKNSQNLHQNHEEKQLANSETTEERKKKLDNKIGGQELKSSSSTQEFTPKLTTNTGTNSDEETEMLNKRKLYHR